MDGQPPPPHAEALELGPLAEALPLVFKRPGWTEDERQRLREGVLQLVQVRLGCYACVAVVLSWWAGGGACVCGLATGGAAAGAGVAVRLHALHLVLGVGGRGVSGACVCWRAGSEDLECRFLQCLVRSALRPE